MDVSLLDPWFEAQFYQVLDGDRLRLQGPVLQGAQGLFLWCPCGHGKPEYPLDGGHPHGLIIPFADRGVPEGHGPVSRDGKSRPRWAVSGTGLGNLTLSPSVDVGGEGTSCWHGHIRGGRVT